MLSETLLWGPVSLELCLEHLLGQLSAYPLEMASRTPRGTLQSQRSAKKQGSQCSHVCVDVVRRSGVVSTRFVQKYICVIDNCVQSHLFAQQTYDVLVAFFACLGEIVCVTLRGCG
eukprot:m.462652 g.462652  ORF g.462652 m.462652 type:complete len:116 (-) comp21604_c0_seq13:166-513(-)